MNKMPMNKEFGMLLIIEPFFGGSHKQMVDTLLKDVPAEKYTLLTLTAKKWHWRARCGALCLYNQLPQNLSKYTTLFCTSVLPLAELIGMCPKLANLKKILYFHENQLVYPTQEVKTRDFQYGYNQIISCLAADEVIFNSTFNMESFLNNINRFLKIMPDKRPKSIVEKIAIKSRVLYYPIDFSSIDDYLTKNKEVFEEHGLPERLCIVWPHRWEFDKNPTSFLDALYNLIDNKIDFEVVIMGQCYNEQPVEMQKAVAKLGDRLKYCGYAESRDTYYYHLLKSHIIVSTSDHEFFGVSMLEGVRLGCFPLVPRRLVYPEIYPKMCLYDSQEDLVLKLKEYCTNIGLFMETRSKFSMDTEKYNAINLMPDYMKILNV